MRYWKKFGLLAVTAAMVMGGCSTPLSSKSKAVAAGGPNDHPVDWQTSMTQVINRHAPAVVEQDPETGKQVVINDGMSTDQIVLTRDPDYKVAATVVDVGFNAFRNYATGSYLMGWSEPTNNWNGNYNVVRNIQGGYVVTHGGQVGHNVNGQIGHNVSGQVDVNGNIIHSGTVTNQHQGTVTHGGTVTHEHTQPPPR